MPEIIVCFKEVVDERELKINPQTQGLVTEGIARKISDFDLNAIEEAVRIKEKHDGKAIGLIMGPPDCKASIKKALSMGLDSACLLSDPVFIGSDTLTTASILAAATRRLGSFDLILCGEASTDSFSAQLGSSLAEWLKIPSITAVSQLDVQDGKLVAERNVEEGIEVVEVSFPALITVTKEINKPRLATLKQIMRAAKKELIEWKAADINLSPDQVGPESSWVELRQLMA
ncbi:MAG: electron transfer flavoprotein subunit beta/FixA family protein, partial [Candidatus Binatia bacterium]|nr:electron transfer flavoprotein subunit beta/FixA family protein [Candidatus Binatia bacterium]